MKHPEKLTWRFAPLAIVITSAHSRKSMVCTSLLILRTEHISHVHFKRDMNNNKMERLNGEIRDGEKVMRGIKKMDSVMFDGYQMYHNYIRPHMGLEGKTPSEVAGIKVEGDNKWMTLIQNASRREV